MKKNKMMRLASLLLVMCLLTTSVISGTFAKYTTSATSNDSARVAHWGFEANDNSLDFANLFQETYGDTVDGSGDVIAPGTDGSVTFKFEYDNADTPAVTKPEVAYTFAVTVVENCNDAIKNNKNIQWKLDNGAWGTWGDMVAAIEALDGNVPAEDGKPANYYEPNTLPTAFAGEGDNEHTISWQWLFEGGNELYTVAGVTGTGTDGKLTQDEYDTYMGNTNVLDTCSLEVTITATQVN